MECMAIEAMAVLHPDLDRFGIAGETKETRW
jgi:hypothetical protein